MKKKSEVLQFKDHLARLEEIAALLEGDEIGLEESITLFEEGIIHSRECMRLLRNAELKITELKAGLSAELKNGTPAGDDQE